MLKKLLANIKIHLKRVAFLCALFLAMFLAGFYLVNLDLKPSPKAIPSALPSGADIGVELQKRLGSTTVAMETYNEWAKRYGLDRSNNSLDADPDKDGLPNYQEYVYGTNPLKADTDGDGFSDKQEIANGYDPDAPGDTKPQVFVHIDKIGVDAPMVWSQSMDDQKMLTDLEKGLSHFYKTAAPGQNGNAIISGHSSNYVWAKGDYNHVFKDLGNLQNGDLINVKTIQTNGRAIYYQYKVTDKFITTADDQRVFADTQNPTLTLSTCWPIGTNLKRIIIKAEIVK
ncbi:MAG TPA: sortase [Patescibacteria group bacterium]